MDKNLLIEQMNLNKSSYQIAREFDKSPTAVRYWIKKYGLTRVQETTKTSKTCPTCGEEKPLTEYYKRRNGKNFLSYCKSCTNAQTLARQRNLKQQCIEYKGGECISCGYNKYPGVLEFHHLDPSQKDFNLSAVRFYSFSDKIKAELDKCILLCSNCHRELHGGYLKYNEETKTIENSEPLKWSYKKTEFKKDKLNLKHIENLLEEGKDINSIAKEHDISKDYLLSILTKNNIFISKMDKQSKTKINWPSKEELQKLLWEKSMLELQKELGVSSTAIKKRSIKLGLTYPPMGYWAKKQAGKL